MSFNFKSFDLSKQNVNLTSYAKLFFVASLLLMVTPMFATGGGGALTDAANTIRGYLPGIKALMKGIAVVVAIVGGIRIFNKWQNGDQDVTKEIIGWVGALIFILLVPTFVEAILPAA